MMKNRLLNDSVQIKKKSQSPCEINISPTHPKYFIEVCVRTALYDKCDNTTVLRSPHP